MSSGTKVFLGFLVGVLVGWAGAAAYRPVPTNVAEEVVEREDTSAPVRLGFIGPLTGDGASLGTVARAAVEQAVEEVNQDGGINGRRLEVVYEDGQCGPVPATNAAIKLINVDKVKAIIGGLCSSETSAFAPSAMEKKVIVFSYASSAPSLSNTGKYFFRSYPSDLGQGKFAAEYAYNKLGSKKVAILHHDTEWGNGLRDVFSVRFKELGGEIVSVDAQPQDSRDYRTTLTKIKAGGADLLYFAGYPEGSMVALKQANELGLSMKILGGDAWADTKLQATVEGLGPYLYVEQSSSLPEDFVKKILARTGGKEVTIGAPNAYDNVKILAEVMKAVGTDPDKIEAAMRNVSYPGVSGRVAFDANGDLTSSSYVVKKIENGSTTIVE